MARQSYRTSERNELGRATTDVRLSLLFLLFITIGLTLIGRLLTIQFFYKETYVAKAREQFLAYQEFSPRRGSIFISEESTNERIPIAENKLFANVYAVPNEVESVYFVAAELATILDLDEGLLLDRLLKEGDPYEPIKNKISDSERALIEEKKFSGIYINEETYRHYPLAKDMSHITGFLGYAGDSLIGQYGVEGFFENTLGGREGYIAYAKDAMGNLLNVFRRKESKPHNGDSVELTIDRVVQFRSCDTLRKYVEATGASGGSVVVLKVDTSEIIAMCSHPSFDANTFYDIEDITVFNNPTIFTPYEPGSVFKAITMAAAINEERVGPKTTYIDEGEIKYGKHTIENSDGKAHGEVDMVTVLNESLNTGAVHVAEKLGRELFAKYVRSFGFGETTGIELSGERAGTVSSLDKPGEIFTATASFGHGITATPIQLVSAYSVLANGGTYIPPTIIKKILHEDGSEEIPEGKGTYEVISPRAATLINSMLVSVVEDGHAGLAGVDGYRIAGKTGTALIADSEREGYIKETNHTFVGYGPIEDPLFVALVKLEKPTSYEFSSGTAAPLFGEIAKFILQYYNIPPYTE